MMAFLSALALTAAQDPAAVRAPAPLPPAEYAPPPVRPFEPPANFSVRTAEGAETARPWRRPLTETATVDAYRGDYEAQPTDAQAAYVRGVAQAELSMDARMGPLDGRWRLFDAEGRPLADLVLSDAGQGVIEGAWRAAQGPGRGVAAAPLRMEGRPLELTLEDWCILRLTLNSGEIHAELLHDGVAAPVRLARPD